MNLSLIYCYIFLFIAPLDGYNSASFLSRAYHRGMENQEKFWQPTPDDKWINLLNNEIESIDKLYLPNSIILSANGVIYNNAKARIDFYKEFKNSVGNIKSISAINKLAITPDVSYEIGSFITAKNITYKHLIIWKKVNGSYLREFEIVSKSENMATDIAGIDTMRNTWMKLCNSHSVKDLITNTYVENAVYYNNNRLTVGTDQIVKEYSYMTNPTYQLTLTPIIVEGVNETLAYEIGQCSGSYGGKYILVWGKRKGTPWKVIFDSN